MVCWWVYIYIWCWGSNIGHCMYARRFLPHFVVGSIFLSPVLFLSSIFGSNFYPRAEHSYPDIDEYRSGIVVLGCSSGMGWGGLDGLGGLVGLGWVW